MSAHAHSSDDHGGDGHDFAHPMPVSMLLTVFRCFGLIDHHHGGSGQFEFWQLGYLDCDGELPR